MNGIGGRAKKKTVKKKTAKKKMVPAHMKALRAPPLPKLPKSLDNPTLTLVIEFDHDEDLSGLLDTIQDLLDTSRENGEVMSAELTNVPAVLDCTKLDRRY